MAFTATGCFLRTDGKMSFEVIGASLNSKANSASVFTKLGFSKDCGPCGS